MVSLWKVPIFIWFWHALGKERKHWICSWWISYIMALWKCEDTSCYPYYANFFTSPTVIAKFLENCIYRRSTVRAKYKHVLSLKPNKQKKWGEHDCQHVKLCLLQNGWTPNPSYWYFTSMIQELLKILKEE